MKAKSSLRSFLTLSGSALLLASQAHAIDYWWDNNGDTAGFGTASGTWSSTASLFSTSNTGVVTPTGTQATTNLDVAIFGTDTVGNGLGTGTIIVDGNVFSNGLTFGTQTTGTITFDAVNGGTITTGNSQIRVNGTGATVIFNADFVGATTQWFGASTTIYNGNFKNTGTSTIRTGHTLQFGSTATMDMVNGTKGINFITGTGVTGTLRYSSNNDSQMGSINGGVSTLTVVQKDGSATSTLKLTSANTHLGEYRIEAGTLQFAVRGGLYNAVTTNWLASKIKVGNTGVLGINVGGTNQFTTADVTTLLTNLGGANGTSTTGFAAGSAIGFDTTNATGGTFTVADVIADSTGSGGGALGVRKLGTNTLVLNNTNTYSGATTIANGTLSLGSSGSIANTSGIYLTGAGAKFNVTTANFNLGANQTLGGIGTVENTGRTLTASGTLAPGSSPGTLTVDGGTLALAAGGDYNFQILDAAGIAGTGYDTVSLINGATLDLSALTAGSYTISLQTLASISPDVQGLADFNSALNYSWTIFSTDSSLLAGFDANDFVIDTTNFTNSLGGGSFSVGLGDNNTDLMLNFTAVPEPRAALLGGLGMLALLRRRRA